MTVFQQLVDILSCRTDVSKGEMYFILASVLMYFKSPLKSEIWNTFRIRIENGELSVQEAMFMTDEEKNPNLWCKLNKKTKQELQIYLDQCLLSTRKYLLKKYPEIKPKSKNKVEEPDIVCVPDIVNPTETPTFFPKTYIKDQLKHKAYTNELTGQQFSWAFVDMVHKNNLIDCTKVAPKCIDSESFLKLMQRDIQKLQKIPQQCLICKAKNPQFKSIRNYQTVYFCSLNCMNKWEVE